MTVRSVLLGCLVLAFVAGGAAQAAIVLDVAAGDQDVTVYAADAGDDLFDGPNVGDINGDGYNDFVIGADNADGPGNTRNNTGEVYVFYGSAAGLPALIDLAATPADVTIYGVDPVDRTGDDVDVGDINGDGYDDILIGAFQTDGPDNTRNAAGGAYVVYGGSALPAAIDLATDADVTIYGGADGERAGDIVLVADLNGDGYGDVIISASQYDGPDGTRTDCGAVYIIYGGTSLAGVVDLATDADVAIYGEDPGDRLGSSAAATGDVDGDGCLDLLVDALLADGPGNSRPDAGEVCLLWGNGLPAVVDLATYPHMTIYGAEASDRLTSPEGLSAGDLNADGYDDVVVGTGGGDGPGNARADAGEGYVVLGGPSRPASVDLISEADVVIYGVDPGDRAGTTGVGDLNGDGYEDIVISAGWADGPSNTRPSAGEAYVILGAPALSPVYDLALNAFATIYGAEADLANNNFSDRLRRIGMGDLNGDGSDDLILAADRADGPGNTRDMSGEAYVFYGSAFRTYEFLGFLPPVENAHPKPFKRGSTIPIKFQIADEAGEPVPNAVATLAVYYLNEGAPIEEAEVVSTADGDWGNQFRYDVEGDLFIFNLSTKPADYIANYTYLIAVTLDDGQTLSANFSLK